MKQSHEFWAPTDVNHGVRLDVVHVGVLEAELTIPVVTVFCSDRGLPTATTNSPRTSGRGEGPAGGAAATHREQSEPAAGDRKCYCLG